MGPGPSPMQSQPNTPTGQPQINSWFSSPSQAHANPLNNNSDLCGETGLDELKAIMLNVQTSVSNMETRFNQFETSLSQVKESTGCPKMMPLLIGFILF